MNSTIRTCCTSAAAALIAAVLIAQPARAGTQATGTLHADQPGSTISRYLQILTAGAINATNTIENQTVVQPASFSGAHVTGGVLKVDLPAKSVVMLTLR